MVFHFQRWQWIITMMLILPVLLGKSFSQARQVKGGATMVVTTHVSEFSVDGNNNGVNLNKDILDPTSSVESNGKKKPSTKKATRNIGRETSKFQNRNRRNVASTMRSSAAASHPGRKRKGNNNGNSNWMAFSEDYRSPKQHPPRNN